MTETAPKLFGTDGVRGPFGEPPLDRHTVEQLGYRLGRALQTNGHQTSLVLGGDTRESTSTIANWLAAGLRTAGADCRFAGILPTPGVATLTRHLGFDAGVAISASHNPHPDNGIKLFDRDGFKWTREAERRLEEALLEPVAIQGTEDLEVDDSLPATYLSHLESSLPSAADGSLEELRIALDCAHGAASPYARRLFEDLGASVEVIGDRPDGTNINLDCGSTHPERLVELVESGQFDLGVAFDGDADRAVFVDETGAIQDGDSILYVWAEALMRDERLRPPTIVATTMSNLGLEQALTKAGIETLRCDVGDRVVVETMRAHDLLLGGEQSGHIIHLGLGSTGDGLMTAVQIAALLRRANLPLSRAAAAIERFPQVLVNVRVRTKRDFEELPSVTAKAAAIENRLGADGRLLLRYSGTEPLARVMIEGRDQLEIETLANDLAAEIETALG